MIFKILSTIRTGRSEYSNEVYSITAYFTWKLLLIRPKSTQKNFLQFFQDDSISQNFFKQCFEYIKFHKDKLSSGVLKDFYSQKHFTDELSQNWYKVDKNLEKQIVSMLRLFCSNDNLDMQNYMRFQDKSVKSYNLVTLISDYTYEFRKYLQYPVAFDTFISWMDALLEFIQGPNYSNQEILIQRSFVNLSNRILMMEYIETDQIEEKTHSKYLLFIYFNYV